MQKITYVKYKCSKCGAEDTDKLFPHEHASPALNCWKCKAGSGKTVAESVMERIGMFPVTKAA